MRSRLSIKKRVRTRQRSRVILEKLDSRVLLSANWDWIDFEGLDDLSDFTKTGYGIPDAFYSDPATWGDDSFDLSVGFDYVEVEGDPDQQVGGEPLSELLEPAAASGVYTLYLDFDGATVYSRAGDFWLGSTSVDIPAYDLGQFGWSGREAESVDYITNFVRDDYAPYNVNVTSDEPSYGQYSTIYVGGTGDWFRPGSSIIGVATYDIGNRDESNFGFAFTEQLGI